MISTGASPTIEITIYDTACIHVDRRGNDFPDRFSAGEHQLREFERVGNRPERRHD